MLNLEKPWLVRRDGKAVARVIMTRSDMTAVVNPRHSPDEQYSSTFCFWNGFEKLGDKPEQQAASLAKQMRVLLSKHKRRHPENEVVTDALADGRLSTLYQALRECDDIALSLLIVKKVGQKHTLAFTQDPEFADGMIYTVRDAKSRRHSSIWYSDHMWKVMEEEQFLNEVHEYDLYLRGSVFDFTVEYWVGTGSPEEHLVDGIGFDQKNRECMAYEMFDLYDTDDVSATEQQLQNLFFNEV